MDDGGLVFWVGVGDGVLMILKFWVCLGLSSVLTDDVLSRGMGGDDAEDEGGVVTMMGLGTMVVG